MQRSTETSSCAAPAGSRTSGSSLCTRCGLCCMGVLHDTAVLDVDEVPRAHELGLPVLAGNRPSWALPCPRLVGTRCGIYQDRPVTCVRYRCKVLQDVELGALAIDQADDLVTTAHRLLAELRSVLPDETSLVDARRLVRCATVPEHLAHLDTKEIRLRMSALQLFLDQRFRTTKEKASFQEKEGEFVMTSDRPDTRYRRSGDAIFSGVGDDVVALHIPRGRCFGMEGVTAVIWNMLAEPSSLERICSALVAEYDVPLEDCRADVEVLLGQLMAEGLVESEGSEDPLWAEA